MVLIVLKNETSLTKGHVFLASVIQHARVHLGVFCCQEGWKKKKQRQVNLTKGLRDCAKLTNDFIWWKMSKQKASWRMLIGLSLKQQELKDIK